MLNRISIGSFGKSVNSRSGLDGLSLMYVANETEDIVEQDDVGGKACRNRRAIWVVYRVSKREYW